MGFLILGLGATGGGVGLEILLVMTCVRVWDSAMLPSLSLFVETCCPPVFGFCSIGSPHRCTLAQMYQSLIREWSSTCHILWLMFILLLFYYVFTTLILCGGGITTTLTSEGTCRASWWSSQANLGAVFFWDAAISGLVWICELRFARTNGVGTI